MPIKEDRKRRDRWCSECRAFWNRGTRGTCGRTYKRRSDLPQGEGMRKEMRTQEKYTMMEYNLWEKVSITVMNS